MQWDNECTAETGSLHEVSMITEDGDGSLFRCCARVARATATGEDGSSPSTPRVRNDPATPRETCAGERTARELPLTRARSSLKAVTAASTIHRANSRTASASTAHEPNDPEADMRLDRMITSSTIGVVALPWGPRTPAPEMEKEVFFSDSASGKQLNLS